MAQPAEVFVSLEFTADPNTLKYVVNRVLLKEGMLTIATKEDATEKSPLAAKLFAIPGVASVRLGRDFVTVSKTPEGVWEELHQNCAEIVEQHLAQGGEVVTSAALEELREKAARGPSAHDAEVIKKIQEVLDQEIRPALAMDGGDISFQKYEDGMVYVHLEGACRGCPGARMTLKMGVERRLCEAIPEVREVIAV